MAQKSLYRSPDRPQKPPMALRPRWASTNPKRPSTRWHTPRAIGRRHLAKPSKSHRLNVRQEQGELVDALRAANPSRWTDTALAELLGIDVAAIEQLPLYRGRFAGMTPLAMLGSVSVWPVTLWNESCGEWAAE